MAVMTRWVLVAATVALAVTACGGDGDSADGGDTPDRERACSLLTDAEAEQVLGVPVYGGEPDFDRTIKSNFCQWVARGSSTDEGDSAYSVFIEEGTDEGSRREFEATAKEDDATPVDDLGDDAHSFVRGTATVPFLAVRVGDHAGRDRRRGGRQA